MNLKEQYRQETGLRATALTFNASPLYSDEYVEWLEGRTQSLNDLVEEAALCVKVAETALKDIAEGIAYPETCARRALATMREIV